MSRWRFDVASHAGLRDFTPIVVEMLKAWVTSRPPPLDLQFPQLHHAASSSEDASSAIVFRLADSILERGSVIPENMRQGHGIYKRSPAVFHGPQHTIGHHSLELLRVKTAAPMRFRPGQTILPGVVVIVFINPHKWHIAPFSEKRRPE
jgi:hypothetical protein